LLVLVLMMVPVLRASVARENLAAFHKTAGAVVKVVPAMQHPSVVPNDDIIRLPALSPNVLR
jgi:hypothetical protein